MPRRKERKYHFIYKTTCLITDRFYIGMHSTDNLEDGYLGSGKRLKYSVKKHGEKNHSKEILEYLTNRTDLKKREAEIVNEDLIKDSNCMNLAMGGQGGILNEDHLKKMIKGSSDFLKARWKSDYNNMCIQNGDRIRIAHKNGSIKYDTFRNKSHSVETKRKISQKNSISQKGPKNSQYGTCWITNGIISNKIHKGDLIPKGWKLGRK